jgi:hypothetical protein
MLFGLMKSLEAQQKTDAALLLKREFERIWSQADVKLSVENL